MREFILLDSGPWVMRAGGQGHHWQINAGSGSTRSSPVPLRWLCRRSATTRCVASSRESTQLGHFFAWMIWSPREGCRTSPYRLPLGVKPPSSGRTPAGLVYPPRRPTPLTPMSSWPLVRRQSVNRAIRSSSRHRMLATSPAIAMPACGRPSSERESVPGRLAQRLERLLYTQDLGRVRIPHRPSSCDNGNGSWFFDDRTRSHRPAPLCSSRSSHVAGLGAVRSTNGPSMNPRSRGCNPPGLS